jgi:uncharacterized protein (DUF983 family)
MVEVYGAEKIEQERDGWLAAKRGMRRCCPACGERTLFAGYIKPNKECSVCGLVFENYRADDGPAYLSIFLVGHIVIPLMLMVEQRWAPDPWVHAALWIPATLIISLAALPVFKGLMIGWQWAKDLKSDERF